MLQYAQMLLGPSNLDSGYIIVENERYLCSKLYILLTVIFACNETNLMHYLSSVYSITIPLHVSGLLVAHHQEVTMHMCSNWYVSYVLVDCRQAWVYAYTLLPPDDGLLASPKHVEL
jgi:hypothetical protein